MLTVKEKLPEFWNLSQETAFALRTGQFSDWMSLNKHISPFLGNDFIERMDHVIRGWKNTATTVDGQTAIHTLLVFSLSLILPEYALADERTRTEIEWAAILHDLDKNLIRRDAAHPFRSAAVAAKIMPNLGFGLMPNIREADLERWSTLVVSALRPDGESMIPDHSSLKEIINGIYKCWGMDSSASRVLKAVLFHQSLPSVKEWGSSAYLTDEELSYSLTINDMKVLGTLMVADSDSWNIFSDARTSYLSEVRENIADTCSRIQKLIE